MRPSDFYGLAGVLLLIAAVVFLARFRNLAIGSLFAGFGVMFVTLAMTARSAPADVGDADED